MANEAVPIELPRNMNAVRRTCANSGTIEKYTLLKIADANLVTASSGADAFGGIAAAEKVTLDGSTSIGAYMTGAWDLTTIGPAITAGDAVSLSGSNLVKEATEAEIQAGIFVGYAEETSTAGSEVIRVRLRGGV